MYPPPKNSKESEKHQKIPNKLRIFVLNILPFLCSAVIAVNIYTANEAYLALYLRYENTFAFYTSLIADVQQNPDFTEGTQLAVIGTWEDPGFYEEHLSFTRRLTGMGGIKPDSYSRGRFMQAYIGFPVPFAPYDKQYEIAASAEFAEMPVYPYYGSMRKIGDTFVVKLSD